MSAHLIKAQDAAFHAEPTFGHGTMGADECWECQQQREALAAAITAEREAWVGKIEALADAWADDTGIEGYINLGEAEDRLRALIAEARP